MYAIIEHGSHQFRVREGDQITIDSHKGVDEGAEIVFQNVLLIAGGDAGVSLGVPRLESARVLGEVIRHFRGKKILIRKFRKRKGFRKRRGHRQHHTRVRITRIEPNA